MDKPLYYIVKPQVEDNEYLTGLKTIIVYQMVNNVPKLITEIEADLNDYTVVVLDNELSDMGVEFTKLVSL